MAVARLRFFKRCAEFIPRSKTTHIPGNTRGIYVLLKEIRPKREYKVMYVGMAGGNRSGTHSRLNAHKRSHKKSPEWTHFSLFEVWDNINEPEIREIEGIIRHIFRKDSGVLPLNVANKFTRLSKVCDNRIEKWGERIRAS